MLLFGEIVLAKFVHPFCSSCKRSGALRPCSLSKFAHNAWGLYLQLIICPYSYNDDVNDNDDNDDDDNYKNNALGLYLPYHQLIHPPLFCE